MKKFKKITQDTEFWVFIIIVILSLIIQVRSGQFFTNNNIVDINKSAEGVETNVVGENNLVRSDAKKAKAILKLKMRSVER